MAKTPILASGSLKILVTSPVFSASLSHASSGSSSRRIPLRFCYGGAHRHEWRAASRGGPSAASAASAPHTSGPRARQRPGKLQRLQVVQRASNAFNTCPRHILALYERLIGPAGAARGLELGLQGVCAE